jgi:molybdopterin/thiamine biosynthesis adenylyltransferase
VTVTLALTSAVWDELRRALDAEYETAGIIAARTMAGPGTDEGSPVVAYLGRRLTWASPDSYLERQAYGLELGSAGWVPATRAALAEGSIPVFIHTHPRGRPEFSERDDGVDASLRAALPAMGGSGVYVALLVAGTSEAPTAAARVYEPADPRPVVVDKIRISGDGIALITRPSVGAAGVTARQEETFDRQIRMFGPAGQRTLGALHVAVVGAGGTGSATAEQLTRLGVGTLTIIDDDVVTEPTPTRGYGMTVADLGRPKAEVLAGHLRRTGMPARVRTVTAPLQDQAALDQLSAADAVFSCVDGHGARLILNRWAYAYLTPVIDVAILVSADPAAGTVTGIDGRVTWLGPGTACLLCRGRIDPAAAYAEILEPEERKRLAGEGYVREAETRQPAVVTLTTLVASLATTELLQRLFGLADRAPTEILAQIQRRELRRNRVPQRPGCFCSDEDFLGRGAQEPHLDLIWPG